MTIKAYEVDAELRFVALDLEAAAAASRRAESLLWIDVQLTNGSGEELAEQLDLLGVGGLSRRLVLEAKERPGLFPLKHELLLTMPVLPRGEAEASVITLTALCRDNLLVTVHELPLWQNRERNWGDAAAWLPARSSTSLLATIMIDLSQFTMQRTAYLRRTIMALEERMERAPESVSAEELVALRPDLAVLGSVVAVQLPAVEALCAIDKPYFKLGDAQDYMHCARANLSGCERAVAGLEQRLVGLRAAFQMHAQDKMNRRLNMLTILSAMFMPLTLFAGIWGMNFETMPELHEPYAYPLALGFMAVTATAMFVFFRRRGWFN